MPRVRFIKRFEIKPVPQETRVWLPGMEDLIKREWAEKAVAQGAAVYIKASKPSKSVSDLIENLDSTSFIEQEDKK